MMPNLVVVGVRKARTTSLYYYLKQHPQVYMSPRKEPHFFEIMHSNFRRPGRRSTPVTNLGDYQALSERVSDGKVLVRLPPRSCTVLQRIELILTHTRHACTSG
jgi:hypothetical protein